MPGETHLTTKLLVCINLAVSACLVWLLCSGQLISASRATDRKTNSNFAPTVGSSTDPETKRAKHNDTELAALRAEAARLVAAKARARYEKNYESEFSRMMQAAKLPSTRKEYAPLASKFGLPVEARENLFTLLAKLDTQVRYFVQLSDEDRTLLGLPKEYIFDESEILTKLRSLLGEQNYAQFVA